jgi:hypothetical protein
MEDTTKVVIIFLIVIGIPLILAIVNLILRIALGYWSAVFVWLLFGYLAILGAIYAAMAVFFRAREKALEVERQRSLTLSQERCARSLSNIENQLSWDRMNHRNTNTSNDAAYAKFERALRDIRR